MMHKCELCDNYQTSYRCHLKRHIKAVHNKDKVNLHICTVCGFTTLAIETLTEHETLHTEDEMKAKSSKKQNMEESKKVLQKKRLVIVLKRIDM